MRLKKVTLKCFRRFLEEQTIWMQGKFTALIGPNEAGKSTILDAIYKAHEGSHLVETDRTRGSDSVSEVILTFDLDRADLELAGLNDACDLTLYCSSKRNKIFFFSDSSGARFDESKSGLDAIRARVPRFHRFSYEDMLVAKPVDLRKYHDGQQRGQNILKPSLRRMYKRIGLDIDRLATCYIGEADSEVQSIIQSANDELRDLLNGHWSQSDAVIYLATRGDELGLYVDRGRQVSGGSRRGSLSDASDGYQRFIALEVFASLNELSDAIVLIDEIEQHLHYDAQADFLRVLRDDNRISSVIYSTHSLGALPEDLGCGIKLVKWKEDAPGQSEVQNKFWTSREAEGFSPVLVGIGASALSFFPARACLLVEGVTDMLLLPQCFREAFEKEAIGFQVVHGLSNWKIDESTPFSGRINAVAFLTDGDKGGEELLDNLSEANFASEALFSIGSLGEPVTVEDIICPQVWLEAVRAVANSFKVDPDCIPDDDALKKRPRLEGLPSCIESRKVEIAYAVLEHAFTTGSNVLDLSLKDQVANLGRDINRFLNT